MPKEFGMHGNIFLTTAEAQKSLPYDSITLAKLHIKSCVCFPGACGSSRHGRWPLLPSQGLSHGPIIRNAMRKRIVSTSPVQPDDMICYFLDVVA